MVDRVTSNDSSSSDLIRLSIVCGRLALLSSTTSSVVFVRASSVHPFVVRQRLVRQLVRLSRCRCWDRRPSQLLSLLRPSSVQPDLRRGHRQPRSPSIGSPLRGRRTSSSSSSSSSTSERRHPVARRPRWPDILRHRSLRRSFVVACVHTHSTRRVRTLVVSGRSSVNCEFWRAYERCYRSSKAWAVIDWLLVSTVTDLFVFCIYNLSVLSIPELSVFFVKYLYLLRSKVLIYLINLFELFKSIHLLRPWTRIVTHRKYTTSLPSTTRNSSLAEPSAAFFSDKVSSLRLKLSSNPPPMPPHSNHLLLLKSDHHFLMHLLTKSLNFCMPLIINNATSTLFPLST